MKKFLITIFPSLCYIVRSNVDFLGIEKCVDILWHNAVHCCFGIWTCQMGGVRR